MSLPNSPFFVSTLVIGHNAFKNIVFRAATYILQFAVFRFFAYLAFKQQDYTSFLMFAEDIIQKTMFAFSRKLNRQAVLIVLFTVLTAIVGFYDTLLWALDSPGYVIKSKPVSAGLLSSQMLESPAYITFISNPLLQNLDMINLNDTFGANLYTTGFNFTLPGIVQAGMGEIVPPVQPLGTWVPPRIWLDTEGFAVGVDDTIMFTVNMNTSDTFCFAQGVPSSNTTLGWNCPIRTIDAFDIFSNHIGTPQIWWDIDHGEFLRPVRKENPWQSLGLGGETALMKQVFTVTKGHRRHTFLETAFKATMISYLPILLDDAEITDFMRRTWSDDTTKPITPEVQALVDVVIAAKNNQTSRTFGSLLQANDTVYSTSTDYLTVAGTPSGHGNDTVLYTVLRFASTTISLLRTEVIFNEPVPFAPCPLVYRNIATGGVVRSTNCYLPLAENQTEGHFLGQIDTSAVVIMSDVLGDGTSNISAVALDETGIKWYNNNSDHIDQLLLSRALILGGNRADVEVEVRYTKAAISQLQLLLILLSVVLALAVWCLTLRARMSYFENSFVAAVFATTHVTTPKCKKIGYMRHPPEVTLRKVGSHIVIGTPSGGTISNQGANTIGFGMSYEPLMLEILKNVQKTDYVPSSWNER